MKTKFFLTSLLLALTTLLSAATIQRDGYALFGEVPTGYTDLTGYVTSNSTGSFVVDNTNDTWLITGSEFPNIICNSGNYLNVAFSPAQTMTLTNQFVIHVKVKKIGNPSNGLQVSFCRENWNNKRIGWIVSKDDVSSDEFTDCALAYNTPSTTSYAQDGAANLLGTNSFNGQIFRFCAANNEQYEISQIYIEAPHEVEKPITGEKRYYFVRGGNLPTEPDGDGYIDLRAPTYAGWSSKQFGTPTTTADGVEWTLPNSWGVADYKPKAQCMADVDKNTWYLRVKFETDAKNLSNKNLRINLSDNPESKGNYYLQCAKYANALDTVFPLSSVSAGAAALRSFPVNANEVALQFHANGNLNGTYFRVIYAYLTNDPSKPEMPETGDVAAPTNVTATVKAGSVSYGEATLTLSAEDETTPITFNVWNADKTAKVATVSSTSGVEKDVTITGLTPETNYTYYVQAEDNTGNATEQASWVEVSFTTTKFVEKRYYFFSTNALPANTEDLISVDMRDGAGSNVSLVSAHSDVLAIAGTAFAKYQMPLDWGFVRVLAKEESLADVNTDWYLCIRYKSTHADDIYASVACHDNNQVKLIEKTENDNLWRAKQIKLSDFTANKAASVFPVTAGNDMFQFDAAGSKPAGLGTLAIDYVYLTNSIADGVDAGYADNAAPVLTVTEKEVLGTSVTLTVKAEDNSDSQIDFAVSNGSDTQNFELAAGAERDVTFSGLNKGTEYTFTVNAADKFGNNATQWSQTITTPGDAIAPVLSYATAEVTPTTITLKMMATDNETADLTYTIAEEGKEAINIVGAPGEEVTYTYTDLTPGETHTFVVTVADVAENVSAPSDAIVASTTALKASEFATMVQTMTMYDLNDHKAGETEKTTLEARIVVYKNMMLFQQKVLGDGQSVGTGTWDNQMWIWNAAETARLQECAAQERPIMNTRIRRTANAISLNNTVPDEFTFNMYANNIFGISGATCSQMHSFLRGYINTPSEDVTAPSIFSVTYEDINNQRELTITPWGQEQDVFFYVKEGENEYISLSKVIVPVKAGVTYECYAIDWNGNISAKRELSFRSEITLAQNADNSTVLSENNGEAVDVIFDRGFINDGGQYTLCLPFALDEEKAQQYFPGTYNRLTSSEMRNGTIELYAAPSATIEAGVPYLYLPSQDVVAPMTIEDVTIDATAETTIETTYFFMTGVYSPKALSVGDYFLYEDNYLYAYNPDANAPLNGFRAYFTKKQSAPVSARARVVFGQQTTTGVESAECRVQSAKFLRDGQLLIQAGDRTYNAQGQIVK